MGTFSEGLVPNYIHVYSIRVVILQEFFLLVVSIKYTIFFTSLLPYGGYIGERVQV